MHLLLQGLHPSHIAPRGFIGGPQAGKEQRQARGLRLAPVDEQRGQRAALRGSSNFDGEDGVGQPHVPVVLSAVLAKARNVPPCTPSTSSALASVFLWWAEPTRSLEPRRRVNSLNGALVNSGSWSAASTSSAEVPNVTTSP